MISRRTFLGRVSALAACTAAGGWSLQAQAEPLGLPLGLQLYSVRQQLPQDFDGTLAQIGSLGFRDVEAAGFFSKTPAQVKQAMSKANLRCVSSHSPFTELRNKFDEIIAFHKELGVQYLICSSPGFKTPGSNAGTDRTRTLSLDDWHFNAEQFNIMGGKAAAAGIKFGYHNHVREFATTEGAVPYMELLRLTDPAKVTFELDCGWAVVAGAKPVEILRNHPGRISMLHVKDFKANSAGSGEGHEPTVTELGLGSIDYRPIFQQAAKTQKIQHMFVEQEAFDMPWVQSLKVDADYMRNLKA